MPAVITYWQTQEDEKDFLAYLTTTGNIVAMPDHWVRTKAELAPRPILQYVHEGGLDQFVFGLEHHALAADIEPQEKEGQKYLTVAYMSP